MLIDRYHAQMGEGSTKVKFKGIEAYHAQTRFYATQRKLWAAPVVGHERLQYDLLNNLPNAYERGFLISQGINQLALNLKHESGIGTIRAVEPGTIMFAGQPFADISGCFGTVQAQEIYFEHAFDLPMTVASRAMDMKRAAGKYDVMDFSLRRNGDKFRANDVSKYAYIGGFDQTSNLNAAMEYNIEWVGTVAHYWQQLFTYYMDKSRMIVRDGIGIHFEQIAFEAWLDANPEGTCLLLDTIDVEKGMVHAANAALSSPSRLKAFKAFRIDSGNLSDLAVKVYRYLQHRGIDIREIASILTGDLTTETIDRHANVMRQAFPDQKVILGVGTKLAAEVEKVAGVIYKMCEVEGIPTLKCSNDVSKATIPGNLQVYRGINENGNFVGDITGLVDEADVVAGLLQDLGAVSMEHLLKPFSLHAPVDSVEVQRAKVKEQVQKLGYLMNYKNILSPKLHDLRIRLIKEMRMEMAVMYAD